VLFVLKIEDIFKKRKRQPKNAERDCFLYIYSIYILTRTKSINELTSS